MSAGAKRWLQWLALVALVVGFLNFTWFFAESATVGDASDGYVRDGRFYLVRGAVATEVSRERWAWAQIHPATLLLTHPLAMAGGAFLLFTVVLPVMLWTGDPVIRRERVERIRASGAATASTRTGGRIGELSATTPLVRVDVHPGGAIITVIWMPPFGIETRAMTSVAPGRYFGSPVVRITHRQRDTPADIRLYVNASSPIAQALERLVPDRPAEGPHAEPAADGAVASIEPADSANASPEPYPAVMKALILSGLALGVVFLVVAVPFGRELGGFGILWSIGLVLILGFNVWRYLIHNRRRW
jgi:hypothetical protein